ncbi:hypothetical protein [Kitasatospora sp. NPDC059571]|uniref:hypothetical protein n=1 Tax=Kitasatospora sp. NPDC059571 TaxID=3346871 RepID=UPI0036760ADB
MLLLGLIFLMVSGTFTGLLIADNLHGGPATQVSVLGNDIGAYTVPKAFLAGVALTLLFVAGAAMARHGILRARRRAVELEATRLTAARTAPARAASAPQTAADSPTGPAATEPTEPTTTRRHRGPHYWHRPERNETG